MFWAFWLQNALRATVACTFSISQLANVVRACNVLYILTSTCASRHRCVHFSTSQNAKSIKKRSEPEVLLTFWFPNLLRRYNSVQFFISSLPRWLRTGRFSEPTFRPSGAQHIGKTQNSRPFYIFRSPASTFFWLFLFFDLVSSSFLFSDSSHPCFSICPYCPKFNFYSKLPLQKCNLPLELCIVLLQGQCPYKISNIPSKNTPCPLGGRNCGSNCLTFLSKEPYPFFEKPTLMHNLQ